VKATDHSHACLVISDGLGHTAAAFCTFRFLANGLISALHPSKQAGTFVLKSFFLRETRLQTMALTLFNHVSKHLAHYVPRDGINCLK